jgi:spore germination cell wall hydrolase CwlJ-like protein
LTRKLKYIAYALFIGAWAIFCIVVLPHLQKEQRIKQQEREQQILSEVATNNITKTVYTTPVKEVIEIQDEDIVENFPKYTDENLILLAQLIEAEGSIESRQCKLYIGSVVLNRMLHDSFPDSLEEVIFQVSDTGVHQFSVTVTRKDGSRAIDCTPSEESLDVAAELITYGTQLPEDVVVFYTEKCTEAWVTSRAVYTQVDHTIFAYAYKE